MLTRSTRTTLPREAPEPEEDDIDDNNEDTLVVEIEKTEGIDGETSRYNVPYSTRLYRVVLFIDPEEERHSYDVGASSSWSQKIKIKLGLRQSVLYDSLKVIVLRYQSPHVDPGTSTGFTLVGEAQIQLFGLQYSNKEGWFVLKRSGEKEGEEVEQGRIRLSLKVKPIKKRGSFSLQFPSMFACGR